MHWIGPGLQSLRRKLRDSTGHIRNSGIAGIHLRLASIAVKNERLSADVPEIDFDSSLLQEPVLGLSTVRNQID